tara:strand:+ start:552 stop:1337 length:786 start_codon:yes stop_codon:yes gene_type:complete
MEPIRNIPNVQVNSVGVYQIPTWQIRQPYVPNFNPVTNYIGFPIVEMPGCVTMHKDDKYHRSGLPVDKSLVENDSGKAMTLCPDGSYPTYDAMNYEPEQMTIIRETAPPPVSPPPDPPGTPETPDTGETGPKDPACPGPNQPRIGTLGPNEKEKVSGYELQPDPVNPGRKICVILYEDIGAVEQYLPSAQVATTTAAIATVAGASALLAKPLADLLLRVFKPAIKQVLTKVNAILGKSPEKPSRSQVQANEYRKKKGLPPL